MHKIRKEYRLLFNKLKTDGLCHPALNAYWLETYYYNLIELGTKQIKSGHNKHQSIQLVWQLFWNGINNTHKL